MSAFYSRSELARFKKYKKHYVEAGYPGYIAENYAWDHLMARRRQKNNQFNIQIRG